MSFELSELNPSAPLLVIDGEEIELDMLTLRLTVQIEELYGSVKEMHALIREKPETLLDALWLFVVDKKRFKSRGGFKLFLQSSNDTTDQWAKNLYACLGEILSRSAPLIKNQKRYQELQQIKGTQEASDICYASYYDSMASRYGYTLDQFYDLTLRQVHVLLKTIGDKKHEELEIQAALQGKKIQPKMDFQDISEEEEKDQDAEAVAALKRLQEDFKKKQQGK